MPRRPRWARFLSEISEWDQRFERDRAPWIELAAGLAAVTVVVVSLLAAGIRWARAPLERPYPRRSADKRSNPRLSAPSAATRALPRAADDLDHYHASSFRTAPSLCADMIFGKDPGSF